MPTSAVIGLSLAVSTGAPTADTADSEKLCNLITACQLVKT